MKKQQPIVFRKGFAEGAGIATASMAVAWVAGLTFWPAVVSTVVAVSVCKSLKSETTKD